MSKNRPPRQVLEARALYEQGKPEEGFKRLVGFALRRARETAGATQAECAAHVGVSQGTVSRWESLGAGVNVEVLWLYGKRYGSSTHQIYEHAAALESSIAKE